MCKVSQMQQLTSPKIAEEAETREALPREPRGSASLVSASRLMSYWNA
jgi:hypothetical protein